MCSFLEKDQFLAFFSLKTEYKGLSARRKKKKRTEIPKGKEYRSDIT